MDCSCVFSSHWLPVCAAPALPLELRSGSSSTSPVFFFWEVAAENFHTEQFPPLTIPTLFPLPHAALKCHEAHIASSLDVLLLLLCLCAGAQFSFVTRTVPTSAHWVSCTFVVWWIPSLCGAGSSRT